MGVEVTVAGEDLLIHVHGIDKFLSFKGSMTIPLKHVSDACKAPEIPRREMGVKLVGAGIPGLIRAGTYKGKDGLAFWDVRDHDKAILVELHDEQYSQLILEVDDPEKTIAMIKKAVDQV